MLSDLEMELIAAATDPAAKARWAERAKRFNVAADGLSKEARNG